MGFTITPVHLLHRMCFKKVLCENWSCNFKISKSKILLFNLKTPTFIRLNILNFLVCRVNIVACNFRDLNPSL